MKLGVYHLGVTLPAPVLVDVQAIADAAPTGPDTALRDLCVSRGPVAVHTDAGEPGMVVVGMVWRSDGHRLFRGLNDTVGEELRAGDFYAIDPHVPHWTDCPDPNGQLIFSPHIQWPDKRTPKKLASDIRMGIIVDTITARRAA